jgi:hypothetical protein
MLRAVQNPGTFRDVCSGRVDLVHHQKWSSLHFLRAYHREGSAHVLPALITSQASLGAGIAFTLQNAFKQSQATRRGLQLQRCSGDQFGLVKAAQSAFVAAIGYSLGEGELNAAAKSAAWFSVDSGYGVGKQNSFPTD